MNDIFEWMTPYVIGGLIGYCWYPIWELIKKIVDNARKATLGDNYKEEDNK